MTQYKVGQTVEITTDAWDNGWGKGSHIVLTSRNGEGWWFGTNRYCATGLFQESKIRPVSEGPVRTETVTKRRIVPGVYGRIRIWADSPSGMVRWSVTGQSGVNCHDMTATELDDLAMVASQLAEALRDDMD